MGNGTVRPVSLIYSGYSDGTESFEPSPDPWYFSPTNIEEKAVKLAFDTFDLPLVTLDLNVVSRLRKEYLDDRLMDILNKNCSPEEIAQVADLTGQGDFRELLWLTNTRRRQEKIASDAITPGS